MGACYEETWKYCEICQKKTMSIVEDGVTTCLNCNTTFEEAEDEII